MNFTENEIQEITSEIIDVFSKRLAQELQGESEELVDRIVRTHRDRLSRVSWKAASKWCKFDEDGPVLMPDGTRIYYRKGNTEVVVSEFSPQVRFLKFKGSLVHKKKSSDNITLSQAEEVLHYSLPLPYTVFIFKFIDGTFSSVKLAFSDKPLRKLEEKPLKPFLTNIDSNLSICLGVSFDRSKLIQHNIVQQIAYVLDYYWQSVFTDEWSSHFWTSMQSFAESDPRMSSLDSWQKLGIENPLQVIEDVNWLQHTEESFGDILVKLLEDDVVDSQFREDLYENISNECVNEIANAFKTSFEIVQERSLASAKDKCTEIIKNKFS